MKHFVWAFVIVSAFVFTSPRAVSQNVAQLDSSQGAKHLLTTMPEGKGRIRLTALSIERSWTPHGNELMTIKKAK